MRDAVRIGAVTMALLFVTIPAQAQNKREMQMMADVRMLQEQNQQLQVTLAQLAETLRLLNGRFDEQANTSRKGFADQNLKVDQFGGDLRVVRERVDETNVSIAKLSQEVEALRLSIPQYQPPSVPALEAPIDTPPSPGSAGSSPAPTGAAPQPAAVGPGVAPQRLFDTAQADYYGGQWDLCISGFDTYLRTFPKSEMAHEAQFYIGECNYSDGKHQDAVAAYTQVVTNFPRSRSAPSAYYKRGLAFERLGQMDRARDSFEQAIKQFPDSDAARLAKQNLDRLNRGRP
ncbi:MAG TPA: tetratricopeptide repeat protein [Vicinamibacterales bacterium]|nr:tetratricopeptide repeat protein [Vicinamibacterales bacterium]